MEKHYSDNGRGRDKNSRQVDTVAAMLAQGQQRNRAERKRTVRKTDTQESGNREANERNCAAAKEGERDIFLKPHSRPVVSQWNSISCIWMLCD